eukprot:5473489-Pleurochrysis_carterae.AAC.1
MLFICLLSFSTPTRLHTFPPALPTHPTLCSRFDSVSPSTCKLLACSRLLCFGRCRRTSPAATATSCKS